jgi:hypothetical protein
VWGALALGVPAAGLWLWLRREPFLVPDTQPALVLVAAAAALGALLAAAGADTVPWTRREVALAVGLAVAAGLVAGGWEAARSRLEPLASTGLLTALDALLFLPALLPAAFVRRPGSLLLGLLVHFAVQLPTGAYGAGLRLLMAPAMAGPAELWLLTRPPRGTLALALAGTLLGAAQVGLVQLLLPAAYASGSLPAAFLSAVLSGALAGWTAARLRAVAAERLGIALPLGPAAVRPTAEVGR